MGKLDFCSQNKPLNKPSTTLPIESMASSADLQLNSPAAHESHDH